MILESITPSLHDGKYYDIEKLAGPIYDEMQARRVAKAWSGTENSDVEEADADCRKRIPTKLFIQKVPQKKFKNIETNYNQNNLVLPSFPTPPLSISSQIKCLAQQKCSSESQTLKSIINPIEIELTQLLPLQHVTDSLSPQSLPDVSSPPQSLPDVSSPPQSLPDVSSPPQSLPGVSSTQSVHNLLSPQLFDVSLSESSTEVTENASNTNQTLPKAVSKNFQYIEPIASSSSHSQIVSTADVLYNDNNINNTDKDIMEFLSSAESDNFIINPPDQDSNMIGINSITQDCCCKNIINLKDFLIKQADRSKKRDQQLMNQMFTLNGSNTRLCAALQQMDKKLNTIMAADSRLRALAVPIPTIPSPFLDLLPVKSEDDLMTVENLINNVDMNDVGKNKEDLKSYIYLRVGRLPLSSAIRSAIDLCFTKDVLYKYSYHGKTKKKFAALGLFQTINDALSGLRTTVDDEDNAKKIVDNYLRHAKPI